MIHSLEDLRNKKNIWELVYALMKADCSLDVYVPNKDGKTPIDLCTDTFTKLAKGLV